MYGHVVMRSGSLARAFCPASVRYTFRDDVDAGRGDAGPDIAAEEFEPTQR